MAKKKVKKTPKIKKPPLIVSVVNAELMKITKRIRIANPIVARIKVLGHTYEATGQTVAEAITNLKPLKGRGVSVLTVNKDGIERSKILNAMLTMNLFSPSHMRREIGLKNAISVFADL